MTQWIALHKKIFLIGVVTIAVVVLLWLRNSIAEREREPSQLKPSALDVLPTQEPTPIPPKSSDPIYTQQELFLAPDESFKILYTDYNQLYTIVIYGKSYESLRRQAEQQLIKQLDVSQVEACRLRVSISTPYFVHKKIMPSYSSFSFCGAQTPTRAQ